MLNAGVEPNIHTYGALIDGCARAGQVAKAFGAYGIMSSKVKNLSRVHDLIINIRLLNNQVLLSRNGYYFSRISL